MPGRAALAREDQTTSERGRPHSALIVNADDWGRDRETTGRTLDCILRGTVSSVSAMVFMEDSERAAAIARERGIGAGLHLNFTAAFSNCSARLLERQQRIGAYLLRRRFAPSVFNPWLVRSFEEVVSAQIEEFGRLYGTPPERLDGHHHMHLCANVLFSKLLPSGAVVRRNFSFEPGEKSFMNRFYRRAVDRISSRRHRLTDFFFALAPLEPRNRLERIFALARRFVVEVETHPAHPEEFHFLAGGEIFRWAGGCQIAPRFTL